jgi:NAD(P)-dependent dehydrogenase (short-subunit alcohol dehydrogenase family)
MITAMADQLKGKVCLVTGATSGIGTFTAAGLAAQGAEVVLAGRNRQKAEDALDLIQRRTGSEALSYLLADFRDLGQVRSLALDFKARYPRLDVLVNNAGAFFFSRRESSYGIEMTLLVNHVAPFLLTNLLLDLLQASAPARIVNVSSDGHKMANMDLTDLGCSHGYQGLRAYARSKLATLLFTYELARRLEGSSVTVNALHPGHVATDMWRTNFPVIGPALKWIMSWFTLTPEEGADNSIYLASSTQVEGVTGKYYVEREAVSSSPLSYDVALSRDLWQMCERLTARFR